MGCYGECYYYMGCYLYYDANTILVGRNPDRPQKEKEERV